jgi:SAM-dependent methyltransferase
MGRMMSDDAAQQPHAEHGGHGHGRGHGHNHGHGHGAFDWAERGAELVTGAEVVAPAVDAALDWLAGRVPHASAVTDVGSGPGVAACALAQRLPDAQVLAVDGAQPLLDLAQARAADLGLAGRLATRRADLPDGLADLPPADLVWVSGVAHHLPDPVGTLRELGRLVRPGGLLALREGGLPSRFLPDGIAPGLLPRLEAITEDLVAAGDQPSDIVAHEGSWPDLLAAAGLTPAGSKSFLLDLPAPLSPAARDHLRFRLEMARDMAGDRVSEADALAIAELLDPDNPAGLTQRQDTFLLTAITVHTASP